MTVATKKLSSKESADEMPRPASGSEDLSGRGRFARNVMSSWLGYVIFIAAGFVMPRLIHDQIGQVMLGIWDLSWSTVNYLSLANLGLGSAVNRYVAKYRAVNDVAALNGAVSSVMAFQVVAGVLVLIAAMVVALSIPQWLGRAVSPHVGEAQWVVAILGTSVAVQMTFDAYRGVLTGCHRWDLHNSIHAGSYALTVAGMALTLFLGGGLVGLALVYLGGMTASEVVRARTAYRVCPELNVSVGRVSWTDGKRMLRFGANTIIAGLPPFLLVQTTNIMLASALGAAALAVFSRPIALLRHVETFLNKFSYVLTPMAGSMQSRGEEDKIRNLFVESSRYGVALALPAVLVLAIFGDVILGVWMGPDYAHGDLMAVLAFGYLLPASQSAGLRILVGMNRHGQIGWWGIGISISALVVGAVALRWMGWSEVRAALLIVIPLTIAQGVIAPVVACRELGISARKYVRDVFAAPVACNVVFAAILLVTRQYLPISDELAFLVGCSAGGLILAGLYWRFIFTAGVKQRVRALNWKRKGGQ